VACHNFILRQHLQGYVSNIGINMGDSYLNQSIYDRLKTCHLSAAIDLLQS